MTQTVKKTRFKPKEPIPDFASREQMAEFWDTHDIADYWDELKPIEVKFAKDLSVGITVRFDGGTLKELRERGKAMGIGPTTLVRLWVLERLREEKG